VLLAGQKKTHAGQLAGPQTKPTKAPDTLLTKQLMERDGRVTTQTMLVSLSAEQQPRLRTMSGRPAGAQHVVLQSQSNGQLSRLMIALRRLVRQQAKQQLPQRSMQKLLRPSLLEVQQSQSSGQLSKLMTVPRRLVRQQAKQPSPQRSMRKLLRQSLLEALPKLLSGQLSKLMTALR